MFVKKFSSQIRQIFIAAIVTNKLLVVSGLFLDFYVLEYRVTEKNICLLLKKNFSPLTIIFTE